MKVILKYFPDLSDRQYEQFQALEGLYADWNSKINVISRKDMDAFYVHHVLHSLAIAKWTHFAPATNVLDLGTGGGFPGIPLAILFPDVNFHLIDARAKKIKVVEAVAEELGLTNLTASHGRVEEHKGQYHFVVTRAVAPIDKLWTWSRRLIKGKQFNPQRNGIIALKGGDLHEELSELPLKMVVQLVSISDFFEEEFFETKKLVHVAG